MWALQGAIPAALWGDDTFAFAGACQRLERLIQDALPKGAQAGAAGAATEPKEASTEAAAAAASEASTGAATEAESGTGKAPSAEAELQDALVACLSFALRRYAMPWARQPVNSLFATATHERLRFGDSAARARLDDMATELARRRATPTQRAKALWTKKDELGATHPLRRRAPGGGMLR